MFIVKKIDIESCKISYKREGICYVASFVYEGVNEEYGRSFILNLDVQYKKLTESEIRQMCIEAKKAIDDVIDCRNLDQNKIIEVDGRTFAPSYKYKTRQQIIDSLSNYCTIDTINDLLVIDGKNRHMVPNISEFVKQIDLKNKKVFIEYIRGLDNED